MQRTTKSVMHPIKPMKLPDIQGIEPGARAFSMGECRIILARFPSNGFYHMSISCRDRYPTWDEVAHARYVLIPDNVTMAMLLPPKSEYVNIHPNCFQLTQIDS